MLRNLCAYGTTSLWDASAFKQYKVNMKHPYNWTLTSIETCMDETALSMQGCGVSDTETGFSLFLLKGEQDAVIAR